MSQISHKKWFISFFLFGNIFFIAVSFFSPEASIITATNAFYISIIILIALVIIAIVNKVLKRQNNNTVLIRYSLMLILCVTFLFTSFFISPYTKSMDIRKKKNQLPQLIENLNHENVRVRWKAAFNLEKLGPEAKDAVPALINALRDKELTVRSRAEKALIRVGESARPELMKVLKSQDDSIKHEVNYVLKN